MSEKYYHNRCLICESKIINKLNGYERAYLHKCSNCKFVFSNKIPSENELIDHYGNYTRNDYLSPITINRYNQLLEKFEKFRKNNTILDVGCGIGYFLEIAKKRGWKVYGTEFTEEAVNICKKKDISMAYGKLNTTNYKKIKFDIITSFEVIEHINDPNNELEKFYKILRKGGLIYLTTPNFNSLSRYLLKTKYNVIGYPEHLSYYSSKTLKKLFLNHNFKKYKIETTGISITRIKTSKGLSKQKIISKSSDDEIIRTRIEKNYLLVLIKNVLNNILNFLSIGDSIKAWFIKS